VEFGILCDVLRIKVDDKFATHKSALRAVRAYLDSIYMNDFDVWLFPTLAAARTMKILPIVLAAALEELQKWQFETLERRFVYLLHREVCFTFAWTV
jgi:hypothetical protein